MYEATAADAADADRRDAEAAAAAEAAPGGGAGSGEWSSWATVRRQACALFAFRLHLSFAGSPLATLGLVLPTALANAAAWGAREVQHALHVASATPLLLGLLSVSSAATPAAAAIARLGTHTGAPTLD